MDVTQTSVPNYIPRDLEREKWGRATIPAKAADSLEVAIREWLTRATYSLSCSFMLLGDDLWCGAVVEHLQQRGWQARGERRLLRCDCDHHRGADALSEFFTITVRRPTAS